MKIICIIKIKFHSTKYKKKLIIQEFQFLFTILVTIHLYNKCIKFYLNHYKNHHFFTKKAQYKTI
jgi:hypothetical protein